jgi:hypothetical protein
VCFDFAGTIEENGNKSRRFQVQGSGECRYQNSGFLKQWRQKHEKGTHAIVANVQVPVGGTKEDVLAALDAVTFSRDQEVTTHITQLQIQVLVLSIW